MQGGSGLDRSGEKIDGLLPFPPVPEIIAPAFPESQACGLPPWHMEDAIYFAGLRT
jgi:hypothetical protein